MRKEVAHACQIDKHLRRSCTCCAPASDGMRCHANWEPVLPSMIAFKNGRSRAYFKRPGKPDWKRTTRCKASNGNGKPWMERCGICPFCRCRYRTQSHRSRQERNQTQLVDDGAG